MTEQAPDGVSVPVSVPEDGWIQVEPRGYLPCSLGVVVPVARRAELETVEREGKQRNFLVRAVVSDHVPLAGTLRDILERPSYTMLIAEGNRLSIFLHHGGDNAVFYDVIAHDPTRPIDYIEVPVFSRYPSNCFWSARTAVSQLLDSLIRPTWQPLTIRRLDLHLEGDDAPLCHQLVLPFHEGVRLIGNGWGMHQYDFLAPYEALIRETITNGSPYYRLLCAYRLYEGLGPLRKILRDFAKRTDVSAPLPKPPKLDLDLLKGFGVNLSALGGAKDAEDFWKKSAEMRTAAAHFLLKGSGPLSLSDGPSYHTYSVIGAILLHYAHRAFLDLHRYTGQHFGERLRMGSIMAALQYRERFILKPDESVVE